MEGLLASLKDAGGPTIAGAAAIEKFANLLSRMTENASSRPTFR